MSNTSALLARIRPQTAVEQTRHDLAHDLLGDIGHLDAQLTESHRKSSKAVATS